MGAEFFAGGNTGNGFVSRFDDVLPKGKQRRVFYIKGGPGVGKSGLMKAVGDALEQESVLTERFRCSGDPDSLDGVAFPRLGAALMDGTAPHVLDPVLPGARDTLVSLGDYLNEKGLSLRVKEIAALQQENSSCYKRCYAYLAAAGSIARAACRQEIDELSARKLAKALAEKHIAPQMGQGSLRRLFARAYTHQGLVSLSTTLKRPTTVSVPAPPMRACGVVLGALCDLARMEGYGCVALCHPLWPEQAEGLYIPELELLFTPESGAQPVETADTLSLFGEDTRAVSERGFDRNAFELIMQRAVEQLQRAKAAHDELEKHYIEHMDFSQHEAIRDRIAGQIMALGQADRPAPLAAGFRNESSRP